MGLVPDQGAVQQLAMHPTASYGRMPGRATLLVKAMDRILGTHTCKKTAFFGISEIT
jgi:hypothetical protein